MLTWQQENATLKMELDPERKDLGVREIIAISLEDEETSDSDFMSEVILTSRQETVVHICFQEETNVHQKFKTRSMKTEDTNE